MRAFLIAVVAASLGMAAWAEVPLPADMRVVPPSPDVPREVAALSGEWRGTWSGVLDSTLVVETIDAEKATVIYAWGDAPSWRATKGFTRLSAKVTGTPSAKLDFGGNITFIVEAGREADTLKVTRMSPGSPLRVDVETFRRVK